MMGGVAGAQSLNVNLHFTDTNPGSFNVQLNRDNANWSLWNVFVTSNGDFQFPTPEHNVSEVWIEFYDEHKMRINSPGDVGSGATYLAGTNAFEQSWNYYHLDPNRPWKGFLGDPDGRNGYENIRMDASNYFSGQLNLADKRHATYVAIQLKNGKTVESSLYRLAPEPASLAMLVPGLVPLGLVLRRRKQAQT